MDERYPPGFHPLFSTRVAVPASPPTPEPASESPTELETQASECWCAGDRAHALRDIALFRATLREALEDRLHELLGAIASDVLARELRLAPPDIRALVARLVATYCDGVPYELRIAAADAAALPQCALPLRVDPALHQGDAALDVRGGTITSTLSLRLASVIEEILS